MRQYSYMYNCSSILDWTVQSGPVLDRTVWSGPAFSGTGPDSGPRLLDRTVRSFYRSPFSNNKRLDRTVRSSIFETELQSGGAGLYGSVFLNGLQKRPRSGPDRTVASLVPGLRSLVGYCESH